MGMSLGMQLKRAQQAFLQVQVRASAMKGIMRPWPCFQRLLHAHHPPNRLISCLMVCTGVCPQNESETTGGDAPDEVQRVHDRLQLFEHHVELLQDAARAAQEAQGLAASLESGKGRAEAIRLELQHLQAVEDAARQGEENAAGGVKNAHAVADFLKQVRLGVYATLI